MATSIKRNFVFNIILTLSTYIINIFLFPYVSRALGVEQIGKIGFVTNVIAYFVLFAMLGVGNVDAGMAYYLNQDAVRGYVMENYK